MNFNNKRVAVELRRKGFTYSEILEKVPVAKSTLSSWLHSVELSKKQSQRLSKKKLQSMLRGSLARRNQRLVLTKEIMAVAHNEVEQITERELWLMGVMLYWAEGSKSKEYRPSERVTFSNSDPSMIKLYLKWLINSLKVDPSDIKTEIYIHETRVGTFDVVRSHWSKITGFPLAKFGRIYLKKNKISTRRRNRGINYYGLLRIRVARSTNLNRKISGWIEGVCMQCGVV